MREIQLHRASADNAGRFVDAGAQLTIGDASDQIGEDRATELLESDGAVEATADEPSNPAAPLDLDEPIVDEHD